MLQLFKKKKIITKLEVMEIATFNLSFDFLISYCPTLSNMWLLSHLKTLNI